MPSPNRRCSINGEQVIRAGKPQQWFPLWPWLFDVTAATRLLRATPRPAQPLPVEPWARTYGLLPTPSGPHTISLIGPGPGFDPQYAMTTDLGEPIIIATITSPDGEPAGPLLIYGCHRLYKAARLGRAHLPSLVLSADETLAIRHDAIPARPAPRRGAALGEGEPAVITVIIWHNVAHDAEGRHTAMTGYQPGHPMVRVFAYQADPAGRAPEVIAEEAFAICNGHPRDTGGEAVSRRYYARELRSLSFPGNRPCCSRSCCVRRSPGLSGSPLTGAPGGGQCRAGS